MIAVFFNLFANATFSLLIGLACVLGCIWLLRIEQGPWKLFLLSLPFVKVLYDFFKGVPRSSILVTNIDPFSLPPGVQQFSVGLGLNNFGPQLKALFTIKDNFGNTLYADRVKGSNISKKFKLNPEGMIDETIRIEVKSKKTNKSEVYTINRSSKYVQETVV
ncbi:MAG: hypothetical protein EOP04_19605, partial [Proteobacteria bacterium]